MMRRNTLSLAVACASLIGSAASAWSQPYSKIIAFGDSLTDTGQYPDPDSPTIDVGGNPIPTANVRLTNRTGPSYLPPEQSAPIAIHYVAQALHIDAPKPSSAILPGTITGDFPGTNYALAGSLSDKIYASIVEENGATVDIGTSQTVRNGYLFDNPKADPNALYYINGGANDIMSGAVTDPAGIVGAASNISNGVNALHNAGAQYIVVANIPDLAGTAMGYSVAQTDPARVAGMSALSRNFNETLYAQLNASKANVILVDLEALLNDVIANPAYYDFESISTCFDGNALTSSACQESPEHGLSSASPNPDALLYFDNVHPTSRAQAIIGQYTAHLLTAPSDIAILPVIGLELVQNDVQQIQSEVISTQSQLPFGNWQGQYSISKTDHSLSNTLYAAEYAGSSEKFSAIGQRRMNDTWRIGGTLSLGKGDFQRRGNLSHNTVENASISAFMLFNDDRYHSSGMLMYSHIRYADIFRHTPLGNRVSRWDAATTKGSALTAHLYTAYDISFSEGRWEYGPNIDILYTKMDVDAYSEASNSVTALDVGKQAWTSTKLNLGAFAQYNNENNTINFTLKMGLMNEYSLDDENVSLKLQTADIKYGELPGYSQTSETAVVTQANLTYSPWAASRISLIYNGVAGQHDQDSLALGLTFHF